METQRIATVPIHRCFYFCFSDFISGPLVRSAVELDIRAPRPFSDRRQIDLRIRFPFSSRHLPARETKTVAFYRFAIRLPFLRYVYRRGFSIHFTGLEGEKVMC
jgi:hypothetical protein